MLEPFFGAKVGLSWSKPSKHDRKGLWKSLLKDLEYLVPKFMLNTTFSRSSPTAPKTVVDTMYPDSRRHTSTYTVKHLQATGMGCYKTVFASKCLQYTSHSFTFGPQGIIWDNFCCSCCVVYIEDCLIAKHGCIYNTGLMNHHINGLVQDCSISRALALQILRSCTKPSIYEYFNIYHRINPLMSEQNGHHFADVIF